LLPALAGANLIYGCGMLELGITFSFTQLVMDNEFAQMIKHVVKGIPVTDETLAVDLIRKVGSFGNFVGEEHTVKYMRELQSQPKLLDRRMHALWSEAGSTDLIKRADAEARRIINTHNPEPLTPGVKSALSSFLKEVEEELDPSKKWAKK
jgi:trimethylamine---corrinoid protein Co-methyltransferase